MNDSELIKMVKEIHEALVGNIKGKPGVLERVRLLERFKNTLNGFLFLNAGTIIVAIITIFFKIGD